MMCSSSQVQVCIPVYAHLGYNKGCTCLAGRRCCHSRSPHRGPSPAVWRASGSHQPDPEARRGGCWQTHSRWLAKGGEQWVRMKATFIMEMFHLTKKNYSPWALRSCSASWCRSPAVSCCAPGRCPCSPDASCIAQYWSQSDNWRQRVTTETDEGLTEGILFSDPNFWDVTKCKINQWPT